MGLFSKITGGLFGGGDSGGGSQTTTTQSQSVNNVTVNPTTTVTTNVDLSPVAKIVETLTGVQEKQTAAMVQALNEDAAQQKTATKWQIIGIAVTVALFAWKGKK